MRLAPAAACVALASLASPLAAPADAPPPRLATADLAAMDRALAATLGAGLGQHLRGAWLELGLESAQELDADPLATDAAGRWRWFRLSDAMFPGRVERSVLRAYESVVHAADCAPGVDIDAPGCRLLLAAQAQLRRPGWPASREMPAAPDIRPVGTGAQGGTAAGWTALTMAHGALRLDAEYLYLPSSRPWMLADFLGHDGWYLRGSCSGAVSNGDPGDDVASGELLPRLPVGLLLTRGLTLRDAGGRAFTLRAPHVAGHAFVAVPRSPRRSDPAVVGCAGAAAAAAAADEPASHPDFVPAARMLPAGPRDERRRPPAQPARASSQPTSASSSSGRANR